MGGWAWDDAATNVVSTDNSTSSNLTANSVFTGTWEECLGFGTITLLVKASHASATNGVKIEWSADGLTAHANDTFTHGATAGDIWSFGVVSQYFRVVYTNGSTNQTSFVLQTILHRDVFKASSHRIGDSIDEDDDADLVKSVITGQDDDGDFHNVHVDEDGNLLTAFSSGEVIPTLGTDLVYDDMNVSNGGLARSTAITVASGWRTLYSYSGEGLLLGILITVEDLSGSATNYWQVRLLVDSVEIFGTNGISLNDMATSSLYNWNTSTTPSPTWSGLNLVQDTFRWDSPNNLPLKYVSSVSVLIRRVGTTTKNFRAGLVSIVKN